MRAYQMECTVSLHIDKIPQEIRKIITILKDRKPLSKSLLTLQLRSVNRKHVERQQLKKTSARKR